MEGVSHDLEATTVVVTERELGLDGVRWSKQRPRSVMASTRSAEMVPMSHILPTQYIHSQSMVSCEDVEEDTTL
jgi:hypothetical protein